VLSPKIINYAKTMIASCMEWLVKQNYLKHNNFQDISSIKFAQTRLQTNNRVFTLKQMQLIFAYAQAQIAPASSEYMANRRILFILKFAFSTGCAFMNWPPPASVISNVLKMRRGSIIFCAWSASTANSAKPRYR
jgi:hypothetical protein